jgi:hypothetical protein
MLQFAEGDIDSAGNMAECKLVFGSHVENRSKAIAQPGD